jgi:hypothetical protein
MLQTLAIRLSDKAIYQRSPPETHRSDIKTTAQDRIKIKADLVMYALVLSLPGTPTPTLDVDMMFEHE